MARSLPGSSGRGLRSGHHPRSQRSVAPRHVRPGPSTRTRRGPTAGLSAARSPFHAALPRPRRPSRDPPRHRRGRSKGASLLPGARPASRPRRARGPCLPGMRVVQRVSITRRRDLELIEEAGPPADSGERCSDSCRPAICSPRAMGAPSRGGDARVASQRLRGPQ